jgi:hypothetical protein
MLQFAVPRYDMFISVANLQLGKNNCLEQHVTHDFCIKYAYTNDQRRQGLIEMLTRAKEVVCFRSAFYYGKCHGGACKKMLTRAKEVVPATASTRSFCMLMHIHNSCLHSSELHPQAKCPPPLSSSCRAILPSPLREPASAAMLLFLVVSSRNSKLKATT